VNLRDRIAFLVWTAALVALVGCDRFEKVASTPAFRELPGKCIVLRREVVVLREDGERPWKMHLSDSESTILPTVARLSPGTQLTVVDVIYHRSFEFTMVVVLVKAPGVEGAVSSSLIFDVDWLERARRVAQGDSPSSAARRLDRALDSAAAEWCNSKEF
jgi:hypothetical protein